MSPVWLPEEYALKALLQAREATSTVRLLSTPYPYSHMGFFPFRVVRWVRCDVPFVNPYWLFPSHFSGAWQWLVLCSITFLAQSCVWCLPSPTHQQPDCYNLPKRSERSLAIALASSPSIFKGISPGPMYLYVFRWLKCVLSQSFSSMGNAPPLQTLLLGPGTWEVWGQTPGISTKSKKALSASAALGL